MKATTADCEGAEKELREENRTRDMWNLFCNKAYRNQNLMLTSKIGEKYKLA